MKILVRLIAIVLMLFCYATYNEGKNNISSATTETKSDAPTKTTVKTASDNSEIEYRGDSLHLIHTITLSNGDVREFYQTIMDYHLLYTKVRSKKSSFKRILTPYYRYGDGDDFFKEGIPGVYFIYKVAPDGKNLYVVGSVHANSNGWVSEYQLFRINCVTLEVKLLTECAAIKATKYGFVVAQARLTNANQATCTAEEIWLLHDEFLDLNGKVTAKSSDEYTFNTMEKLYSSKKSGHDYVRNFNMIRYDE